MKSSNWFSVRIIRDVLKDVSLSSQQVSSGGTSPLSLFKGPVISYGEEGGAKQEVGIKSSFTPTERGWIGQVLAMLKRERRNNFEGNFI